MRFDNGTEKKVKPANLRPGAFHASFAVGDRVQIHGLSSAAHLNGACGKVIRIDYPAERYSRLPKLAKLLEALSV